MLRQARDLDALRERAILAHQEFVNHFPEKLNRRRLLLSVVTIVFLPPGGPDGTHRHHRGRNSRSAEFHGVYAFCPGAVAVGIVLVFKLDRRC
ncbi:hypothetical protein JCM14713_05980 [Desulfomicrobium salsuginis]